MGFPPGLFLGITRSTENLLRQGGSGQGWQAAVQGRSVRWGCKNCGPCDLGFFLFSMKGDGVEAPLPPWSYPKVSQAILDSLTDLGGEGQG